MYDVKVLHLLDKVIESLEVIQQRTENIHCTNDFLDSATGTLLLDGVCMKLIATGESIKNLDKLTAGNLLIYYPQIPWREVMGMRDIIVHHYFEVDADVIFNTVKENIPLLMDTLLQMRETYRSVYEFPEFAEYGKLISFAFVIVVATTDDLGIDIETL